MNNIAWAIVVLAGAVLGGIGVLAGRGGDGAVFFGGVLAVLGLVRMLWFHGDPD